MKILHLISSLSSGGAQKLVEDTVPLMNDSENIEVEVLVLNNENNVFDKNLIRKGIKIHVITLNRSRNPINIYYIRKYITKGKYDIVHVHLFPTNYWSALASITLFNNKPDFIYTEHSTHNRRRNKWYLYLIEKFIYSCYTKIISISPNTQANLIEWLNVKGEYSSKYKVIENGVNIGRFVEAKPYQIKEIDIKLCGHEKLICMVGRFSRQKDQATIIRSMKLLPNDIHLLLIGEGELKQENEDLSKSLGVANRVHFLGFRNDIDRILKTVDIVILSSHWEGFGLAAVEGMAAAKPVIASNVPGLSEVVEGAGLLFEKGNYNQLSNIIRDLLMNESYYLNISEACLIRGSCFDINKMVTAYIKVYEEVSKGNIKQ
ncbi:glycosyltransferase [Sporosarcina sp. P19]|uniref:glycosyltransferase n=1 Tax=Sporosarcina sp. P19 TaxID=2048258 RepID=UPI000C172BBD|nr:glycosyltransferase [Sporosarcina sp. P19]PIC77125.1 glycosyltransferase [Sporosarcina sp. P19]